MIRFPFAALAVAVALSPLAAQAEIEPAKAQSVLNMLRAYGCTLSAAQVPMFMADMGTTPEEYAEILADAVARGFASGDAAVPGGVTLNANFCTLQHADSADALLVEVMRYNGCQLTGAEMPGLLPPLGFAPDLMRAAVAAGAADGRIVPTPQVLTLSEAACNPM